MDPARFEHDTAEPLAPFVREHRAPPAFGDARCLRIEYSCRGDRVPGRVLLPKRSDGPLPVIVLQHGIGGSKDAPYMEAAAPWVQGGVAVASIDFPLHGERVSPKFSERLLARPPHLGGLDATSEALWSEFARQSVLELRRLVDALVCLPELDAARLAYAGFSLGGIVGAVFCGVDPRPRAAALALAGANDHPSLDPRPYVASISPRPLLVVGAHDDATIPREATQALYESAHEPKKLEWFDGDHGSLPGKALKTMWLFLRAALQP